MRPVLMGRTIAAVAMAGAIATACASAGSGGPVASPSWVEAARGPAAASTGPAALAGAVAGAVTGLVADRLSAGATTLALVPPAAAGSPSARALGAALSASIADSLRRAGFAVVEVPDLTTPDDEDAARDVAPPDGSTASGTSGAPMIGAGHPDRARARAALPDTTGATTVRFVVTPFDDAGAVLVRVRLGGERPVEGARLFRLARVVSPTGPTVTTYAAAAPFTIREVHP